MNKGTKIGQFKYKNLTIQVLAQFSDNTTYIEMGCPELGISSFHRTSDEAKKEIIEKIEHFLTVDPKDIDELVNKIAEECLNWTGYEDAEICTTKTKLLIEKYLNNRNPKNK